MWPCLAPQLRVTGALSGLDDGKVFCNRGVQPLSLEAVTKLWTDIRVAVIITPKDGLIITRGNSSESALSGDDAKTTDWNGTHYLRLSPFGVDCVGLVAVPVEGQGRVEYELSVRVGPAYRGLVLLAVGVGLLVAAPHLSRSGGQCQGVGQRLTHTHTHTPRSVTLFYGAGVTFGVIASILILLYVFSKFVPKVSVALWGCREGSVGVQGGHCGGAGRALWGCREGTVGVQGGLCGGAGRALWGCREGVGGSVFSVHCSVCRRTCWGWASWLEAILSSPPSSTGSGIMLWRLAVATSSVALVPMQIGLAVVLSAGGAAALAVHGCLRDVCWSHQLCRSVLHGASQRAAQPQPHPVGNPAGGCGLPLPGLPIARSGRGHCDHCSAPLQYVLLVIALPCQFCPMTKLFGRPISHNSPA